MSSPEFVAYGKTPRLYRSMLVTEKIDGTNACVIVETAPLYTPTASGWIATLGSDTPLLVTRVAAQSRNRVITPDADNHGFAKWVAENAESLASDLGPGRHFGEWWGRGIARAYGMGRKVLSLFNAKRWEGVCFDTENLRAVPVLHHGELDTAAVRGVVDRLATSGSAAAPGFMRPEGVIVWHEAAGRSFKVTIDDDDRPKGCA